MLTLHVLPSPFHGGVPTASRWKGEESGKDGSDGGRGGLHPRLSKMVHLRKNNPIETENHLNQTIILTYFNRFYLNLRGV